MPALPDGGSFRDQQARHAGAAATIIGLALGAGNEEKARQCLRRSLLLALSATVVLAATALLLGGSVLRLYVADAAILVSSLKAIGNVRTPLLMALLGSALNISVSWLLGIRLGLGQSGIWAGYGADLVLRSIVGLCMWRAHVTRRSYPILEQK